MLRKKSLFLLSLILILSLVFVACGQDSDSADAVDMQYIGVEDLKEDIESGSGEYVILDVRKVEDYNTSHIRGSVAADVDAANKGGDDETGTANLKAGLKEATGSETGSDGEKYALVCYSGKSYAEKATELMVAMGISEDQIFTLEGGITAWEEGGDEYTELLD